MGEYLISNLGGSEATWTASGTAVALDVNVQGFSIGSVNVITDPNRTSVSTYRQTANSGTSTQLTSLAVANGFELVVKALSTNTSQVGVGSNFGVIGSAFNMYPNDAIRLSVDNANRLFFVTITNGDGIEVISET